MGSTVWEYVGFKHLPGHKHPLKASRCCLAGGVKLLWKLKEDSHPSHSPSKSCFIFISCSFTPKYITIRRLHTVDTQGKTVLLHLRALTLSSGVSRPEEWSCCGNQKMTATPAMVRTSPASSSSHALSLPNTSRYEGYILLTHKVKLSCYIYEHWRWVQESHGRRSEAAVETNRWQPPQPQPGRVLFHPESNVSNVISNIPDWSEYGWGLLYVPSTQGRIIHSTMVGGGPCMCRLVRAMCCEASSSRKRKVR